MKRNRFSTEQAVAVSCCGVSWMREPQDREVHFSSYKVVCEELPRH